MQIRKDLLEKLIELASDSAEYLNEKWITVKPHGADSKGVHVKVEDGETSKQAVERKFKTKAEEKDEEPSFKEVIGEDWAKVRSMPKEKMIKKYLIGKDSIDPEGDLKFYLQYHPDELTEKIWNKHYKEYKSK